MNATLELPSWTDAPELILDPIQEAERLEELRSLNILDTPSEERFDRITRLAAEIFHVPIAYVAFIEEDRQWYKSSVGICEEQTTRGISFCQYTIQQNTPLIIPDTRLHPIGKNHPMVVGEPHIRFYAGIPLSGPRGQKIGSFCIVDLHPRKFDQDQIAQLTTFAALVEREINLGQVIQDQNELLLTRQLLVDAQNKLTREFNDAAKYVRLMLPSPFSDREIIDWHFHPSTHLGGDGLGYRRIDDDRIAFYVLDVTGHGLGSALLAVTALELLRNPVAQIDFSSPSAVVERLNRTFQMKDHAGKFFSVWYGVYSRSAQRISYANAGHPPAVLVAADQEPRRLVQTPSSGSVLGVLPEIQATEITLDFPPGSELYLFSDGIYELSDDKGGHGSYLEFLTYLQAESPHYKTAWETILRWFERAREEHSIDDDVTFLRFATPPETPAKP